jgi:chloramphenicol 3-O phosphotransferase
MTKPITIVLNGTSSSGKSSLAKALVAHIPGPVWIAQVDAIHDMLHCEQTLNSDEILTAYTTIINQLNTLLSNFAETNYAIIVDQVFEQQSWLSDCITALNGRQPIMVGVHCDLADLEQRELARGDRKIGLAKWQFDLVHQGKNYDIEINTSHLATEVAAKYIAEQIRVRAQPP